MQPPAIGGMGVGMDADEAPGGAHAGHLQEAGLDGAAHGLFRAGVALGHVLHGQEIVGAPVLVGPRGRESRECVSSSRRASSSFERRSSSGRSGRPEPELPLGWGMHPGSRRPVYPRHGGRPRQARLPVRRRIGNNSRQACTVMETARPSHREAEPRAGSALERRAATRSDRLQGVGRIGSTGRRDWA